MYLLIPEGRKYTNLAQDIVSTGVQQGYSKLGGFFLQSSTIVLGDYKTLSHTGKCLFFWPEILPQ